jgi:hypothetical protein
LSEANDRAILESRLILIKRLTETLDPFELCKGLPFSNTDQLVLLNICLIELGVVGIGAAKGVPYKRLEPLSTVIAAGIATQLETFREE